MFASACNLGNMNERWRFHVDKVNEDLLCPQPTRPTNTFPPSRKHSSDSDVGFEILDIFLRKTSSGDCSPPYFCGSPPGRTGNPLIHDVQFIHQATPMVRTQSNPRELTSSSASRANKPPVRIEGFIPPGSDSRSVSAQA